MLSPNMTTDFPCFCSLFSFLSFSCSEFVFLFCWCFLPFTVSAVKLRFHCPIRVLHRWYFVVLLYSYKARNNEFYLMFHGCLHDRNHQRLYHVSLIVEVRSELLRLYFLIALLETQFPLAIFLLNFLNSQVKRHYHKKLSVSFERNQLLPKMTVSGHQILQLQDLKILKILHEHWFLLIHYIVCESLNTELLSVKTNKSVF